MEKLNISVATDQVIGKTRKKVTNGRQRVEPLQVQRTIVSTVAGDGSPGFLDGPALMAKFKSPLDVAILPDGAIYVADAFNSSIRKIEDGIVSTYAGNGNANITNGIGNNARFKMPSRLTLDSIGNLYILDAADPRIRKITPLCEVSIYAGSIFFGCKDGCAITAQFGQSFGLTELNVPQWLQSTSAGLKGSTFIFDPQFLQFARRCSRPSRLPHLHCQLPI